MIYILIVSYVDDDVAVTASPPDKHTHIHSHILMFTFVAMYNACLHIVCISIFQIPQAGLNQIAIS